MSSQNSNTSSADNITPLNLQGDIKAQAGDWLVRMDRGELSDHDRQALQAWAAQSEFHSSYLQKLASNWDAMNILQELSDLFPLPEREMAMLASNPVRSWLARMRQVWRMPWLAGGAAATCALIVALLLPLFSAQQIYTTAVGEQAAFVLADGTEITLNTHSRVSIDYGEEERVVRLHRGEVNFDVAKNPQRPFVVYAGDGLVWAVGTAFNVRKQQGAVDVTVTEGRVKVIAQIAASAPLPEVLIDSPEQYRTTPSDVDIEAVSSSQVSTQEAFLVAGETLRFDQRITARERMVQAQLDQRLAWKNGALIFEGETLEQALTEISRYTQKEILIVDPAIKTLRIGGHFKVDDIEGLLLTLSESFGIKVSYVGDDKIHLSEK